MDLDEIRTPEFVGYVNGSIYNWQNSSDAHTKVTKGCRHAMKAEVTISLPANLTKLKTQELGCWGVFFQFLGQTKTRNSKLIFFGMSHAGV